MEAAICTSNHCVELIALDKLGKSLDLNCERKPQTVFTPFIKPASYAVAAPAGAVLARGALKLLKSARGKRQA
jgi:hypothetical protein